MFLKADSFFAILAVMRICWIRGRYGGGKTLLGVAALHELVKRGMVRGVIANTPTTLPLQPWREIDKVRSQLYEEDVYTLANEAGVLFDEPWNELDNRTSLVNNRIYVAFIRKLGLVLFLPSVIPLDKRVSYLSVERVSRFFIPVIGTLIGLVKRLPIIGKLLGPIGWLGSEVWIYRWTLDMSYMQDTGTFWLVDPEKYFGMYDSSYKPLSDAGISELLIRTIEQDQKYDIEEGRWYYGDGFQEERTSADTNRQNGAGQVRGLAFGVREASGLRDGRVID